MEKGETDFSVKETKQRSITKEDLLKDPKHTMNQLLYSRTNNYDQGRSDRREKEGDIGEA